MTPEKKDKLAHLLNRLDKDAGLSPYAKKSMDSIRGSIPTYFQKAVTPYGDRITSLDSALSDFASGTSTRLNLVQTRAEALALTFKSDHQALNKSLRSLVSESVKDTDAQLRTLIASYAVTLTKAQKDALDKLNDQIEHLYRMRAANGSNNVQAILNVFSGVTQVANNVTALKFTGVGQTTVQNTDGSVSVNITGGATTIFYTETPSGLINGSNRTYTLLHNIATVFSFAINGQYLHPTADYTFTGAIITLATALDASLSGKPFTITYA